MMRRSNLAKIAVLTILACSPAEDENPEAAGAETAESTAVVDSVAVMAEELGVEPVGPGVISTDRNETFPAEDPSDGSLWFSIYQDSFDAQTIYVARRTSDGWEAPRVAPFSGTHGDRAPRFSPDGRSLYFTSNRPRQPGGTSDDMNIWRVMRTDTTWSQPELLSEPLNSVARDIHVAASRAALWVASNRSGSFGASDIYRTQLVGDRMGETVHLPEPINSERSQPDIWVSPDESWMILVITDHPDGLGGDDLYVSRFERGQWTDPRNLGIGINSPEYEYGPTMSRDGEYIYFTSHRSGSADVYRVPLESVLRSPS